MYPPKGVRYFIVTGGRGSGKSYAVSTILDKRTYDDGYNILFTRYTMTSADISIIPEFSDKLDVLNNRQDFDVLSDEVKNLVTGGTIFFRGIMQSAKNQTAKLKSIPKLKLLVVDEAEELVDEASFDTLDLSIRATETVNEVWLVLNPKDVTHWIYKRFFKKPKVPEDFNGVVGNTCYIHTSYLDNIDNLSSSFCESAEKMISADPEKYDNVIKGHWRKFSGGIIYKNWIQSNKLPEPEDGTWWYGLDWGFSNDPTAIVRIWYDHRSSTVCVKEICYSKGLLIGQIASIINSDKGTDINYQSNVYCDPARPENIAELRRTYGINAVPAVNKDKVGRVDWLKGCRVMFSGADIEEERSQYCFLASPLDKTEYTNIPQDGGDHLMDAINYGAVTHLRRLGVHNGCGES